MPKGIKGFQLGHRTSWEVRKKIGDALRRPIYFNCDYCGKLSITRLGHYKRKKRHFCSQACYSSYRREILKPEEHNSWKGGFTKYEAHRRWVARHKEHMSHLKARRYARERGAEGSHTLVEWQQLKEKFKNLCAKCSKAKPLTKDHIIPLSEGGSDYIANIQPLCRSCNSKKWKFIYSNPELLSKEAA